MVKIKPHFVYDEEDIKTGVVLTIEDFEKLIDELEDYHDYQLILKRSGKKEKLYTLDEVREETRERMKK